MNKYSSNHRNTILGGQFSLISVLHYVMRNHQNSWCRVTGLVSRQYNYYGVSQTS